jgi:hypothetical protein
MKKNSQSPAKALNNKKNLIDNLKKCLTKKGFDHSEIDDVDLCLDYDDESGANGFWDLSMRLICQKYDIVFVNDDAKAYIEFENLYYELHDIRNRFRNN